MSIDAADFYVTRREAVAVLRKQLQYILEVEDSATLVQDRLYLMPRIVPMARFAEHLANNEVLGVLDARATDADIAAMAFGEPI
ncbi:MAG: hypothetical protein KGL39_58390 [Patescibacteria group bacterium]|nr:hypothetical protein [Patescibacteria group bacterium]